jgi:RNA polymerase sigma factor (sigma-70 family)
MRRRRQRESDASLITAYAAGDVTAFEELYMRYETRLFGYILGMVGEREEAEDLFQETFYKVLRTLDRYREQGSFRSWLFTVASNLCRDHLRSRARRTPVDPELVPLKTSALDPEGALERKEDLRALSRLVADLPDVQREVVLLRTRSGLSFREIARLQDCPLGTALGRMHMAVKRLRKGFGLEER